MRGRRRGGEEGRRHNMNYDLYVTTNVQGPSYFNKKKPTNKHGMYGIQ
jgi:hypothetical protein